MNLKRAVLSTSLMGGHFFANDTSEIVSVVSEEEWSWIKVKTNEILRWELIFKYR